MKLTSLLLCQLFMLQSVTVFCQQVSIPVETKATRYDQSKGLAEMLDESIEEKTTQEEVIQILLNEKRGLPSTPALANNHAMPAGERSLNIEQNYFGAKPAARLIASFDGLGAGFEGPQGVATVRNPSDNSLAVGPNHIMQTVNSRMAIFTKKGAMYDSTGKVLYGPVETRNVFRGFGGPCS